MIRETMKRLFKDPELIPQQAKEIDEDLLSPKIKEELKQVLYFLRNKHEQWFSGGTDLVDRCFDLGGGGLTRCL